MAKSIKVIGDEVKKMSLEDQLSFAKDHEEDARKGIQKIVSGIKKTGGWLKRARAPARNDPI